MRKTNTTPAKIKAYAESRGVEFSWSREGRCYSVECWSPEGKRWSATGTHFYTLNGDGFYTRPDWSVTMQELREVVAFGFEDCDDSDCDVCNPE